MINPILPILKVERLAVQRGERLLFRALDFSLAAGEILHLAGTNGAGKTSLLRVLAGLGHALEGRVELQGRLIYLGHALGLKGELTVAENLQFLLDVAALPANGTLEAALTEVGLARYHDFPVGSLSAGQKKRVGLARLLLEPADLWLLDEPFSALDVKSCGWLAEKIDAFAKKGGAVLFTSHQRIDMRTTMRELDLSSRREGA